MESNISSDESNDFGEFDGFEEEEYVNFDIFSAEFMGKFYPFRHKYNI